MDRVHVQDGIQVLNEKIISPVILVARLLRTVACSRATGDIRSANLACYLDTFCNSNWHSHLHGVSNIHTCASDHVASIPYD